MKRIFALILSFALLLSCLVLPAGAMFDPSPVYQVQAQSAYIVNTDTNIIVYEKDSTKQVSAGGLTKYMTIALVLTNYADQLDNTFQMPFAISDYVHNTNFAFGIFSHRKITLKNTAICSRKKVFHKVFVKTTVFFN